MGTPSFISFNSHECLIGTPAKNKLHTNPQNTIFDFKFLLGRKFSDPQVQEGIKRWPFKVLSDQDNPKIQVEWKGEMKEFSPEQICSLFLRHLKVSVDKFLNSLGCEMRDVVLTVPAHFQDAQRIATKEAGIEAGLNVVRILSDPFGACLAYGLDKKNPPYELNILVFHLGGGTLDVSVLTLDDGIFETKAKSAWEMALGGKDFENGLVDFFVRKLKKKYQLDVSNDPQALGRLRSGCERAKRVLSLFPEADIEIGSLCEGFDLKRTIKIQKFEELNMDLLKRCIQVVREVLKEAQMSKGQIHEVILTGGSSHIKKVEELLQNFFNGKELNKSIPPEEVVARGAAIQAAILSGAKHNSMIDDIIWYDIAPLSLGLETTGGRMLVLIPRSSVIPIRTSRIISVDSGGLPGISIQVYEGERALTKDNYFLGQLELTGISPLSTGKHLLEVTFEVDVDRVLLVSVNHKLSGSFNRVTFSHTKGKTSEGDVEKMVKEWEMYGEKEQPLKYQVEARSLLEHYAYFLKGLADSSVELSEEDKSIMNTTIDSILDWIEIHPMATSEDYETKKSELKSSLKSYIYILDPSSREPTVNDVD
eukprot:TRINITY_DN8423_c0_g2_i2.p1 TRINITY_DN8423_c0_g2~~TRINITY_DN8423_c0_g2_i2.p1  ORF type:complete len:648 (-),score=182.54 TRINITY_DN8423_c0_g2_i2:53-1828(-)